MILCEMFQKYAIKKNNQEIAISHAASRRSGTQHDGPDNRVAARLYAANHRAKAKHASVNRAENARQS